MKIIIQISSKINIFKLDIQLKKYSHKKTKKQYLPNTISMFIKFNSRNY